MLYPEVTFMLSCILSFSVRLFFAIINFKSIIHEFDSWFNYRTTLELVRNSFYKFLNLFDKKTWYPQRRIVRGTVNSGLMFTSGLINKVLNYLSFTVDICNVFVLLVAILSCFNLIVSFMLTRELWNTQAGSICEVFMSLVAGYISSNVYRSYDNEGVSIFVMLFTFSMWIKSLKPGSVYWIVLSLIVYFHMDFYVPLITMCYPGRPSGRKEEKYLLKQFVPILSKQLNSKVLFICYCIGGHIEKAIEKAKFESVLLLENLRLFTEEEGKSVNIQRQMIKAKFGRSKVCDKILLIFKFLDKINELIVAGGMAFTFVKYIYGMKIGASLDYFKINILVPNIREKASINKVNIYLLVNLIISQRFAEDAQIFVATIENIILRRRIGLNIGSKSMIKFSTGLKKSITISWNEPRGFYDWEKFSDGIKCCIDELVIATKSGATTIIGGGRRLSHVSTGGGERLKLIESQILPGINIINNNKPRLDARWKLTGTAEANAAILSEDPKIITKAEEDEIESDYICLCKEHSKAGVRKTQFEICLKNFEQDYTYFSIKKSDHIVSYHDSNLCVCAQKYFDKSHEIDEECGKVKNALFKEKSRALKEKQKNMRVSVVIVEDSRILKVAEVKTLMQNYEYIINLTGNQWDASHSIDSKDLFGRYGDQGYGVGLMRGRKNYGEGFIRECMVYNGGHMREDINYNGVYYIDGMNYVGGGSIKDSRNCIQRGDEQYLDLEVDDRLVAILDNLTIWDNT